MTKNKLCFSNFFGFRLASEIKHLRLFEATNATHNTTKPTKCCGKLLWRKTTAAWIAISGNYAAQGLATANPFCTRNTSWKYAIKSASSRATATTAKQKKNTKNRNVNDGANKSKSSFYHARHVCFLPDFYFGAQLLFCCSLAVFHSLNRLPRGSKKKQQQKMLFVRRPSVSHFFFFDFCSFFPPCSLRFFVACFCCIIAALAWRVTQKQKSSWKADACEKQKGIPFGEPLMLK